VCCFWTEDGMLTEEQTGLPLPPVGEGWGDWVQRPFGWVISMPETLHGACKHAPYSALH
jgi:hypothetical protein